MKNILILIVALIINGCATSTKTPMKEIVYVDKPIPFYIVPEPPQIKRPEYAMDNIKADKITLRNNPGLVSRAIILTMKQKDEYIILLEDIINKYRELSVESKTKLRELSNENTPLSASENNSDISGSVIDANSEHLRVIILTEDFFKDVENKINEIGKETENVEIERYP